MIYALRKGYHIDFTSIEFYTNLALIGSISALGYIIKYTKKKIDSIWVKHNKLVYDDYNYSLLMIEKTLIDAFSKENTSASNLENRL